MLPIAVIPALFALQQAFEGAVWLTKGNATLIAFGFMYKFLFFAFCIWPIWIPFSLFCIETNHQRRSLIAFSWIIGFAIALLLLLSLLYYGSNVSYYGCGLVYDIHPAVQGNWNWGILWYMVPTIAPFFISSQPGTTLVGIVFALSALVAWLVWQHAFISVWCFFAACIGSLLVVYLPHWRIKS